MMTNNIQMMNDMELDNVTGGAFKAAGYNQDEVITLKNIVKATSDAFEQAISRLRTDSIRLRTDSIK